MFGKLTSRNRRNHGDALRAQAIVEFAIALPVLLMLLVGIMEVGRLLVMYAMVNNASRDAVRYASSWGVESSGAQYARYAYCSGIKTTAKKSGYFLNLQNSDISILYDSGPSTASKVSGGCNASSGEDGDVTAAVSSEDRVIVTVTKIYNPLLALLPIPSRTITSSSSRTILGIVDLD
jgi:Flp pilus assembly protein TadG